MVFNPQNPNAPPIYPCGICHKEVHDNDQAILCESGCNFWFHRWEALSSPFLMSTFIISLMLHHLAIYIVIFISSDSYMLQVILYYHL